jgi:phosphonopyruvate decarboxylase
MIQCPTYCRLLQERGYTFFTGAPDSLLTEICACVTDRLPTHQHIIAANEGAALALAVGHHLATSRPALVYTQNPGLGNTINPVSSLSDPEVYGIPMLLLAGWRGQPGVKDEPQHVKQRKIIIDLLETLGIHWEIHTETIEDVETALDHAMAHMKKHSAPFAFLVKKEAFDKYKTSPSSPSTHWLTREEAVEQLLGLKEPNAIVVSTAGMTSLEVFEHRALHGQGHHRDYLTVGGMGHASQIASRIAHSGPDRPLYCLDDDGGIIMYMDSPAIIGSQGQKNFRHIVINNEAHDSVGGRPTKSPAENKGAFMNHLAKA